MKSQLRFVTTMMGDFFNNPTVRAKHIFFFETLARRFKQERIFDASLRRLSRWMNALSVASMDRARWREHFYKNPAAFRQRSRNASVFLKSMEHAADFSLQIGALFDAASEQSRLPNIIYSDYTSTLSSRKPNAGRSPFVSTRELDEWIALEKSALQNAAHICTRSNLVRQSLIQDYKIQPDRITVVGGGVNFDSLPEPNQKAQTNGPVILFIGKEFYRKGGDILLKAFEKVRSEIPSARLRMVTSGDIPHEYSMVNVEVIDRQLDRQALADFYRNADVFALPSRLETWGDVLLEAMAFGLPCIGAQVDAMEEIIQQGETGFLVPAENADALASQLTMLLRNAELRNCFGMAARKKVESEFLWDHVVDRLAPVITQVSEHSAPKGVVTCSN